MKKIHFKDNGQDLLWLMIDATGTVVDCNLQKSIKCGFRVVAERLEIGKAIPITSELVTGIPDVNQGNLIVEKTEQVDVDWRDTPSATFAFSYNEIDTIFNSVLVRKISWFKRQNEQESKLLNMLWPHCTSKFKSEALYNEVFRRFLDLKKVDYLKDLEELNITDDLEKDHIEAMLSGDFILTPEDFAELYEFFDSMNKDPLFACYAREFLTNRLAALEKEDDAELDELKEVVRNILEISTKTIQTYNSGGTKNILKA